MNIFGLRQLGACLGGVALAVAAQAAPVSFLVSPGAFTPGAGYGVDAAEATGTLLDVSFGATPGFSSFSLGAGQAQSLAFGSITLNETGLILPAETDDLSVTASLLFLDPLAGLRAITASGTATVGLVGDLGIDLTIDWAPVLVGFGNGGLFRINMNTQNFTQAGQTRDAMATIRLLSEPTAVPEPGSLALALAACVALGLAGAPPARRRRAR